MTNASVATYERVYVWELPVRFYHWVNALCVVVLIATGYMIGNPLMREFMCGSCRSGSITGSMPSAWWC